MTLLNNLAAHFQIDFEAEAKKENTIKYDNLRFSILTDRIIRIEYDPENEFDDRPTQLIWNRNLATVDYDVDYGSNNIIIETEKIKLKYKKRAEKAENKLNKNNLKISLKENDEEWFYGKKNKGNLKGTYRTLDGIDGEVELDKGLLSKSGWAVIDDRDSLVFNDGGWLQSRSKDEKYQDFYFLTAAADYQSLLKDFSKLTGDIPLIPRWALGNWWSRYWEYTDQELKDLMQEFEQKDIPLSVCIVDMDWHRVENKYTSGWTGYSWNKDYFPEPKKFIDWLHSKGLKTALNLHPADGVYPHEDLYQKMAEKMGVPEKEEGIDFDLSNLDFINAYFELIHNKLEDEDGVDFWWIDWQQGTESGLTGLDPLWGLNHLHFYDLARNKDKRSFIFSRWGGLGSHRYPVGFSGDTVVSWDSLKFQPYFTSTASNVLYGWWSHDIGGHCMGTEDRELYTRWLQFGVFSPIMRLHSTKDPYLDRRPWGHGAEVLEVAREYMQLRHQLIPYLYTHSYQAKETALSLIRPMYYQEKSEPVYSLPDQYYFGSELIAAPFLEPADEMTNLSKQTVWLPEGDWYDYFSGEYYQGESWYNIYGDLSDFPLFAKAGAIIPLNAESDFGDTSNPEILEVQIFPGADNCFELYEDNGAAAESELKTAKTVFKNNYQQNQLNFKIKALKGSAEVIPENRRLKLIFRAVNEAELDIYINGKKFEFENYYNKQDNSLTVEFNYKPENNFEFNLKNTNGLIKKKDLRIEKIKKMLKNFKVETAVKTEVARSIEIAVQTEKNPKFLERFSSVLSQSQLQTLLEIIYSCGSAHIKNANTDKIVIFKGNLDKMSYNLSRANLTSGHHRSSMENEQQEVKRYELIDLKELNSDRWKLTINYTDFIKKEYRK